jgi:hypothetical protein
MAPAVLRVAAAQQPAVAGGDVSKSGARETEGLDGIKHSDHIDTSTVPVE